MNYFVSCVSALLLLGVSGVIQANTLLDVQNEASFTDDEQGAVTIKKVTSDSKNKIDSSTTKAEAKESVNKSHHRSDGVIFKLKEKSSLGAKVATRKTGSHEREDEVDKTLRRHGISASHELKRSKHSDKKQYKKDGVFHSKLDPGVKLDDVLRQLRNDPNIEWAEENLVLETYATTPDDTFWLSQYRYSNSVNLPQAWDVTTGSPDVVIGVIDTGVDYTHPDLANNIWHNPNEIPDDGIDNDNNGYIDDVIGWDFVSVDATVVASDEDPGPPDNDPMDVESHGTHVSGIAAAEGNNGQGIAGVSWYSRIMPLRAGYKSTAGSGLLTVSDIVEALYYACDMGADIINMSFGAPSPSKSMEEALQYCADKGVFLVAAAGNANTDASHYPAGFNTVFSVAASDDYHRNKAYFSNYGPVDMIAPGSSIYSTVPGGLYAYKSGTSMASPFVAGLAALVKSVNPYATRDDMRNLLRIMAKSYVAPAKDQLGAGYAWLQPPMDGSVLKPKVQLASIFRQMDPAAGGVMLLRPSVKNYSLHSQDVSLTMTTTDPHLIITDNSVIAGIVDSDRIITQQDDVWRYQVLSSTPGNYVADYQVHVFAGGQEVSTETYQLELTPLFKSSIRTTQETYGVGYLDYQTLEQTDGRVSLFYQSQGDSPAGNQLYHRVRSLDGSWSAPFSIPAFENFPRHTLDAAAASDGSVHIVYKGSQGSYDTEVYYGRLDSGSGALWETGPLTSGAGLHVPGVSIAWTKLKLVLDADDNPMVFWSDYRDGTSDVYWMRFDGVQWTAEQLLIDNDQTTPANFLLERMTDGRIMLLYSHPVDDTGIPMAHDYMIYDGLTWSTLQTLVPNTNYFYLTDSVIDSAGVLHVSYRTDYSNYDLQHIMYDGKTWTAPQTSVQGNQVHTLVANELGGIDLYQGGYTPLYPTDNVLLRARFDGSQWSEYERVYDMRESDMFSPPSFGHINRMSTGEVFFGYGYTDAGYKFNLLSSLIWDNQRPSGVTVNDAGDTVNTPVIMAAFNASSITVPVSGYRYAFGSAPGLQDLFNWSPLLNTSNAYFDFTNYKNLTIAQDYYVSAWAMGSGSVWSEMLASDGIKYLPDNAKPIVVITDPVHKSYRYEGDIELIASANDVEDGDLTGVLTWSSSLDGPIDSPAGLSLGTHILTASVTDSGGFSSSDTAVVTIIPNAAPVIAINNPVDGSVFKEGDSIELIALATDEEDGDISNAVTWSSSIDGDIVSPAVLSVGIHTLTASVRDSGGKISTASVQILVEASTVDGTDLAMVSVSGPDSVPVAGQLAVSGKVVNKGNVDTYSYVYVHYFLSTDAIYDSSDTMLYGSSWTYGLKGGDTKTVTANLTIPSNIKEGDYYLLAITDFYNRVTEIDDPDNLNGNNRVAGNIVKVKLTSDLAMNYVTGPSTASLGQTVDFSGAFSNLDTQAPVYGNIRVYYYLSKDAVYDSNDKLISMGISRSSMSAGQTVEFSSKGTLPFNVDPGEYYLLGVIDQYNLVREIDDPDNLNGNNLAVGNKITLNLTSDLAMNSISGPTSASVGETIDISGSFSNLDANAPVYGTIKVYYYLSKDTQYDSSDVMVSGGVNRSSLAAGQKVEFTGKSTLPYNMEPGEYYLLAIIDGYNLVREVDDPDNLNGNNLAVGNRITLKLTSDLAMNSISGPVAASLGQTVDISGSFSNLDTIAPVYGSIKVYYYLSKDTLYDSSDLMISGGVGRSSMSAGQKVEFSAKGTLPYNIEAGEYYLLAVIDGYNLVKEIDDPDNLNGNNLAVGNKITLKLTTDLAMKSFSGPSSAAPGQVIDVNGSVSNLDTNAPVYGSIKVYYYLSKDVVFDSNDIMISGNVSLSALSSGQTYTFSRKATIPTNVPLGKYYLLAVVDGYHLVTEIDDPNNLNGNNLAVGNQISIE